MNLKIDIDNVNSHHRTAKAMGTLHEFSLSISASSNKQSILIPVTARFLLSEVEDLGGCIASYSSSEQLMQDVERSLRKYQSEYRAFMTINSLREDSLKESLKEDIGIELEEIILGSVRRYAQTEGIKIIGYKAESI